MEQDDKRVCSRLNPAISIGRQQLRVLQLLAQGWAPKEIARELNRSIETVREHIHTLEERLGARTSAELMILAVGHGFVRTREGDQNDAG